MRELYRRGGAFLCFLLALVCFFSLREIYLQVEPVDMGERYRRAYAPAPEWGALEMAREVIRSSENFLSLPAFIDEETRDRLEMVSGPSWEAFFAGLFSSSPEESLLARRGEHFHERSYYFLPSEEPFGEVYSRIEKTGRNFSYLSLESSENPRFASLALLGPGEARSRKVPSALLHPLRTIAPVFLLLALGIYFGVSRRKIPPSGLIYARAFGFLISDLVAFFMSGFFMAFPFFLVPEIFNTSKIFSFTEGSIWITLIFWGMGGIFGALLYWSAKYASFCLCCLSEGLEIRTLRKEWRLSYGDLERVEFVDYRPPKWLRRLLWIGSLLNWRLLGQSLLLSSRRDWGVRLVRRNGESFSFLCTGLKGVEQFFRALKEAKVPLSSELREFLESQE